MTPRRSFFKVIGAALAVVWGGPRELWAEVRRPNSAPMPDAQSLCTAIGEEALRQLEAGPLPAFSGQWRWGNVLETNPPENHRKGDFVSVSVMRNAAGSILMLTIEWRLAGEWTADDWLLKSPLSLEEVPGEVRRVIQESGVLDLEPVEQTFRGTPVVFNPTLG